MAQYLSLTKGLRTLVDDEDYEVYKDLHLSARYASSNQKFYARLKISGKTAQLHRLIMNATEGDVDHISGDTLDNRRSNLRLCSRAQNCWNRKRPVTSTTGEKDIYHRKDRDVYVVKVGVLGKRKYIGYYKLLSDAVEARNEAVVRLHGEFARTA
jgi:hypothetical protein